jgi:hypothetical protein
MIIKFSATFVPPKHYIYSTPTPERAAIRAYLSSDDVHDHSNVNVKAVAEHLQTALPQAPDLKPYQVVAMIGQEIKKYFPTLTLPRANINAYYQQNTQTPVQSPLIKDFRVNLYGINSQKALYEKTIYEKMGITPSINKRRELKKVLKKYFPNLVVIYMNRKWDGVYLPSVYPIAEPYFRSLTTKNRKEVDLKKVERYLSKVSPVTITRTQLVALTQHMLSKQFYQLRLAPDAAKDYLLSTRTSTYKTPITPIRQAIRTFFETIPQGGIVFETDLLTALRMGTFTDYFRRKLRYELLSKRPDIIMAYTRKNQQDTYAMAPRLLIRNYLNQFSPNSQVKEVEILATLGLKIPTRKIRDIIRNEVENKNLGLKVTYMRWPRRLLTAYQAPKNGSKLLSKLTLPNRNLREYLRTLPSHSTLNLLSMENIPGLPHNMPLYKRVMTELERNEFNTLILPKATADHYTQLCELRRREKSASSLKHRHAQGRQIPIGINGSDETKALVYYMQYLAEHKKTFNYLDAARFINRRPSTPLLRQMERYLRREFFISDKWVTIADDEASKTEFIRRVKERDSTNKSRAKLELQERRPLLLKFRQYRIRKMNENLTTEARSRAATKREADPVLKAKRREFMNEAWQRATKSRDALKLTKGDFPPSPNN